MSARFSTALRNAQLIALDAFIGNNAKMAVYDGTQPAAGGTATNKLAELTWSGAFAFNVANGNLDGRTPADTTGLSAAGSGTTATWCRVTKSDGTFAMDLTVGVDVAFNTTTISNGETVKCTVLSITRGNP